MVMPYIVGQDPETDEIIVGDSRTHTFFLRGPSSAERTIRDLVQAANMYADSDMKDSCEHEFVDIRNEYVRSGEMCLKCGKIRPGNADDGDE
jgi:hypothetical protein